MFVTRCLRKKGVINLRSIYMLRRYSQQATDTDDKSRYEGKFYFPCHTKEAQQRESLVQNFCIGKLDEEFIPFPEPQSYERNIQFLKWLKTLEEYMTQCAKDKDIKKKDILFQLKEFGVFRGIIDELYGGLNMLETELAKVIETVSVIPWIGIYLVQNSIIPARLISKFGTKEQKLKYLPRIVNGEICSVCVTEDVNRIITRHLETIATQRSDNSWTLNGAKTLVINGMDAGLFLVVGHCVLPNQTLNMSKIGMALVERNSENVICHNIDKMVGHPEISLCTVEFDGVNVPPENIIHQPEEKNELFLLKEISSPGKQNMAAVAVGTLRNFIAMLTTHVLQSKYLDKNMHEHQCVMETLGRLTTSLYAMESTLYYTAAIIDTFEDQDVELEQAITEAYCANECVKSIQAGLHLIGKTGYLNQAPYLEFFKCALGYATFFNNNMDGNIYIGSAGVKQIGKIVREDIIKLRNAFMYPLYMLKRQFDKKQDQTPYLEGNLHESLQSGAQELEERITNLRVFITDLLELFGTEVTDQHLHISRLSEAMTQIYVTLASLSRASRSYCIGLKNSDYERMMSLMITTEAASRIADIIDDIVGKDILDRNHKMFANQLYQNKGYFVAHVLNRQ